MDIWISIPTPTFPMTNKDMRHGLAWPHRLLHLGLCFILVGPQRRNRERRLALVSSSAHQPRKHGSSTRRCRHEQHQAFCHCWQAVSSCRLIRPTPVDTRRRQSSLPRHQQRGCRSCPGWPQHEQAFHGSAATMFINSLVFFGSSAVWVTGNVDLVGQMKWVVVLQDSDMPHTTLIPEQTVARYVPQQLAVTFGGSIERVGTSAVDCRYVHMYEASRTETRFDLGNRSTNQTCASCGSPTRA